MMAYFWQGVNRLSIEFGRDDKNVANLNYWVGWGYFGGCGYFAGLPPSLKDF
jgi:hypothetical protein